jgi:1,2-diacylglycerol 3-alpha-glucosyltransferase
MKVALVCCGLEHIQRGFESFSRELFDHFQYPGIEFHLYKGSGKKAKNEWVIPCIRRNSSLLRFFFKANAKGIYYKYKIECYSFAFMQVPSLLKHKYDVIHFSDNELGRALMKIRKMFGLKCQLLFSNGAPWDAAECKIFDGVQEVTKAMQQKNLDGGVKPDLSWYVPYGIAIKNFSNNNLSRSDIRKKYGIPQDAFVVLSLSAIKFTHKRLDWLIKESATLGAGFYIIMAGAEEEETAQVKALASQLLTQDSYQFLTVPGKEVAGLLTAADLMVSTSLSEAFGRVLIEAAASRIPLLTHPHEAAKEIIADEHSFVDMSKQGALAGSIQMIRNQPQTATKMVESNYSFCRDHFDWSVLDTQYADMYREVRMKNSI